MEDTETRAKVASVIAVAPGTILQKGRPRDRGRLRGRASAIVVDDSLKVFSCSTPRRSSSWRIFVNDFDHVSCPVKVSPRKFLLGSYKQSS